MAGNWITHALSMLDVRESGGQSTATYGRNGGGVGKGSDKQGWANKDTDGNSSIAHSNQQILDRQLEEKAREAWEDDDDPDKAKTFDRDDAIEHYRPDLSSSEQSNRRGNREQERKDEARQAVKDYVASEKEKAEKEKPGSFSHEDAQKAAQDARDKQAADAETADETKGTTKEKGKAAIDEGKDPGGGKGEDSSHDHTEFLEKDEIQQMIDEKFAELAYQYSGTY